MEKTWNPGLSAKAEEAARAEARHSQAAINILQIRANRGEKFDIMLKETVDKIADANFVLDSESGKDPKVKAETLENLHVAQAEYRWLQNNLKEADDTQYE